MSFQHGTGGRIALAIAASLVATSALSACGDGGKETVRFAFSKREAITFMQGVVDDFNASHPDIKVEMDTSGVDVTSASFVRGNPPDFALANYNMETARFVQRCALSDLSDMPAAAQMTPDFGPLLDEYGECEGRLSAIPYSVMSAAVIYNQEIFEEQGLEVPTTWEELIQVADSLKEAGIDPFYATWRDDWTIGQGWYDYSAGGMVDIPDFFQALHDEGTSVGPDSAVSFSKDMAEPVDKMLILAENYTNADADSRNYGDGNLAFAQGKAAMYLQGPWAFSEIAKTAPDLKLGTFPLPMTDDPEDLKVRVNIDLAAWIPEASTHKEAAREFMEYVFQPEIIQAYNDSQLGFVPTVGGAAPSDPRVAGMIPYFDAGAFYQGPSVLVPKTIPIFNYMQGIIMGDSPAKTLAIIDADWARLAKRG